MEKKKIKVIKTITHVHDGDCPECGFPETVYTRNAKTGKLLKERCSANCGWEKLY